MLSLIDIRWLTDNDYNLKLIKVTAPVIDTLTFFVDFKLN